jgi:hypothetical protein
MFHSRARWMFEVALIAILLLENAVDGGHIDTSRHGHSFGAAATRRQADQHRIRRPCAGTRPVTEDETNDAATRQQQQQQQPSSTVGDSNSQSAYISDHATADRSMRDDNDRISSSLFVVSRKLERLYREVEQFTTQYVSAPFNIAKTGDKRCVITYANLESIII